MIAFWKKKNGGVLTCIRFYVSMTIVNTDYYTVQDNSTLTYAYGTCSRFEYVAKAIT
jgi:hypothetical protein